MAVRSIRRLFARGALGGVLAILVSGVGSVVLAADHGIDIAGFAFSPQSVTIALGDTVTWTNADAQGHTASADDGNWDTGTIAANATGTVTMLSTGTLTYHCKIHPQMTGTVVVAAAPPPTDALAADVPRDAGKAAAWPLLGLVALGGLALGRRRFAGATEASPRD